LLKDDLQETSNIWKCIEEPLFEGLLGEDSNLNEKDLSGEFKAIKYCRKEQ
jgi:hypothetical protein